MKTKTQWGWRAQPSCSTEKSWRILGPRRWIRTAPVVLLTLNGGINGVERDEANDTKGRQYSCR